MKPAPKQSRQARYIASGRPLYLVLRDPAALDALRRLEAIHGGITAAVTHALKTAPER